MYSQTDKNDLSDWLYVPEKHWPVQNDNSVKCCWQYVLVTGSDKCWS